MWYATAGKRSARARAEAEHPLDGLRAARRAFSPRARTSTDRVFPIVCRELSAGRLPADSVHARWQGSYTRLVDGPKVLHNSSLGDQVYDVWGTRHNQEDNAARACASDGDCPATHRLHSCLDNVCEPGSLPAPEATGTCRDKACLSISEKTHVFDARRICVEQRRWRVQV